MTSSSSRRESKHRTPKLPASPGDDLAKQFYEVQRLRQQVHELEQRLAAIDRPALSLALRAGEARRRK